jgi:Transcription termination factor nusG
MWIVAQVNFHADRLAAESIAGLGFPVLSPRIHVKTATGLRWRVAQLFPGYLFLKIDKTWRPIARAPGVLGVIKFGEKPSQCPDIEIRRLLEMTGDDGLIRLRREASGVRALAPGAAVAVINGAVTFLVDGEPVGKGDLPVTIPLSLGLSAGVCVGSDAGAPVMTDYKPPFAFAGTVKKALVDVTGEAVEDMAAKMRMYLARQ